MTEPRRPRDALSAAFRKVRPNRDDFEGFKTQLSKLLAGVNKGETEEFHKNLIRDFLNETYYGSAYFVNTKGYFDLVIHEEETPDTPVGVILETKKPDNTSEMVSKDDLNRKALHELILYYLRERITNGNLGIKHLIITNTYEWFIFDARDFEKAFVDHKKFLELYKSNAEKGLVFNDTKSFYEYIAKPFVAELEMPLPYTHVDLRDYDLDEVGTADEEAEAAREKKLISLYKLFSPEHLLKLSFANDSNTLDKTFYAELLHIIGLTETKVGGKKLIVRQEEAQRGDASLVENAILQLRNRDKLSRLAQPADYGASRDEQLFYVALELSITWINRVLFLKLLESQLKSYHKGDKAYAFLNAKRLSDYDALDTLFFGVLARRVGERQPSVADFEHVPYLNSSLFEPTELEQTTLFISNLTERPLELYPQTVLKDALGKRRTGQLDTLHYLFDFLDAYDFSSEGSEAVQEESKTLINASVLGLIFEKINGYKDGSFFTPGAITMYMSRESIRRAALAKFNEVKNWRCQTIDELYNKIDDKEEANAILNSLKLCDPAVGSGHFLVSALNELLTLKSDLKILTDEHGKTLRDYKLIVSNDELVITDDDGELFEYNPRNAESVRVQKTLFLEKQTLIETCLFGVDINPNSVKICRLRLWIELLKNAYYKDDGQLETLPNIDINIKVGNSLISRFALDADLGQALKKSELSVEGYRNAVQTYRNAADKEQKREMERLIERIKGDFRTEIANNDPKVIRLENSRVKRAALGQAQLFEESAAQKKEREKLDKDIAKLTAEIEEVRSNQIFEHAFEWRFEFPEVLGEEGEFIGFDVILGNPPYIRQEAISKSVKVQLGSVYETYHGSADLFVYFIELGMKLLRRGGTFSYIVANKWMRANYGKTLRTWLKKQQLLSIIDYGDLPVFENATTYPCILFISKDEPGEALTVVRMEELAFDNLSAYVQEHGYEQAQTKLDNGGWSLASREVQKVLDKLGKVGVPLGEYVDGKIYRGVLTGLNEAFVIDEETRANLIAQDPKSAEVIKPFLAGRDVKRYRPLSSDRFLIFARRDIDIDNYPAVKGHLEQFKESLIPKPKDWKGQKWQGRKPGPYEWYEIQDTVAYYEELEKPKILFPDIGTRGQFTFDDCGYYAVNTVYFIPSDDRYLLSLINSNLMSFVYGNAFAVYRGGYLRFFSQYVEQLPIRTIDLTNPADKAAHERMLELVHTMLSLHKQKTDALGDEVARLTEEIGALDREIDALVYQLYDLTDEEIAVVEASVAG